MAIRLILANCDAELEERNIKDLYTNIVLIGIHGESASTAVIGLRQGGREPFRVRAQAQVHTVRGVRCVLRGDDERSTTCT